MLRNKIFFSVCNMVERIFIKELICWHWDYDKILLIYRSCDTAESPRSGDSPQYMTFDPVSVTWAWLLYIYILYICYEAEMFSINFKFVVCMECGSIFKNFLHVQYVCSVIVLCFWWQYDDIECIPNALIESVALIL